MELEAAFSLPVRLLLLEAAFSLCLPTTSPSQASPPTASPPTADDGRTGRSGSKEWEANGRTDEGDTSRTSPEEEEAVGSASTPGGGGGASTGRTTTRASSDTS